MRESDDLYGQRKAVDRRYCWGAERAGRVGGTFTSVVRSRWWRSMRSPTPLERLRRACSRKVDRTAAGDAAHDVASTKLEKIEAAAQRAAARVADHDVIRRQVQDQ